MAQTAMTVRMDNQQKEALKKFSESLGEKNYEEHKSFFGKFKL